MRRAMTVTREGILRMMRASHPGMYEYEYKAEFDYALTSAGVLEPAFHSIISAGENNFCIHYDSYMGQAKDGDMIWQCSNCGHIHVGKQAPEVCPACNHPQSYFELREENY